MKLMRPPALPPAASTSGSPRPPRLFAGAIALVLACLILAAAAVTASPVGAQTPAPVRKSQTPTQASTPPGAPPTTTPVAGASAPNPNPPITSDPNSGAPGKNTWALAPAGAEAGQAGDRPYFSYELAPGAAVKDAVTIYNYSDNDLVFDIYGADAFNTIGGGFDLLAAGQPSKEVGAWAVLENQRMPVSAHHSLTIPFTLTVPAEATPGDHAGGMVASLSQPGVSPDGKAVLIDHRAGSRLYVRVPGPLDPSFVIDSIDTTYLGTSNPIGKGELDVTYTVRNAGNVRLRGHQLVKIHGPFGLASQEHTPEDLTELLPGSTVTRTEHFADVVPTFRVTADVTITPITAIDKSDVLPEPTTRSAGSWAVPWTLLAIVAVALVAWRVVRRLRRHAKAKPVGGTGNGPGGGGTPSDGAETPASVLAG